MSSTSLESIASTLNTLASPDMKPKALFKAARERHPDASKKEIVRAAFYAVIASADADPEKASRLQSMALLERSVSEEAAPTPRRNKKKTRSNRRD